MGEIRLEGLQYFAHHGYHHEERKLGNRYTVDVKIHTEFGAAATDDDIEGTINYEEVYRVIGDIMTQNAKLLEHLAYCINQTLLSKFKQIERVEVKVSKHNPPLKGICDKASVILSSNRE